MDSETTLQRAAASPCQSIGERGASTPSTTPRRMKSVRITLLSWNPEAESSRRNSSSVRSRPPEVTTSIYRSSMNEDASAGSAQSGSTSSKMRILPFPFMARRHAVRIMLARSSSQSWTMRFIM
jgi:hypothetical protein